MMHTFITKLSEKEKKIFYATILFVSLAVFDRLFFGPVLEKISQIDTKITQEKNDITRDLRFLSYKNRIKEELGAFDKYFTKEQQDDNVVNAEFLSAVERIATEAKISLVKSTPAEVKKKSEYIEYYANLDCKGSLENIITFIHMLNSSDELLKVVQYNLVPKRGATDEVNVSMMVMKMVVSPDTGKTDEAKK
jgi:hypothetical protein